MDMLMEHPNTHLQIIFVTLWKGKLLHTDDEEPCAHVLAMELLIVSVGGYQQEVTLSRTVGEVIIRSDRPQLMRRFRA